MFRGGPARLGHDGSGELPETRPSLAWVFHDGTNNVPATFWSSPLVDSNRLYVGGSMVSVFGTGGSIYGLSTTDLDPVTGKPRLLWKHKAQFAVFSSPALARGLVVCGEGLHTDKGARLYALKADTAAASTNRLAWDFKVEGTLETSPCVEGDRIYFGSADDVYCVELGTGRQVWKATAIGALTDLVSQDATPTVWGRAATALASIGANAKTALPVLKAARSDPRLAARKDVVDEIEGACGRLQ
jgi:outer membrane protein assembly factor BamB